MKNLPQPTLGGVTALTVTTPDLEISSAFYKKLGFSELFRSDWPFPLIQISDGALMIMLRKDAAPYLALTYYAKNPADIAKTLEAGGITFSSKPAKKDQVKRYLLQSPDKLNISIVENVGGFKQPKGRGMLQLPNEDYFRPEKYVNKSIGMFGELAHPVADLERSISFWEQLGFNAVSRFTAPYPWAIVTDGLSVVGLHQTDRFVWPAITYFASDMQDKIRLLKDTSLSGFTDQEGANATLVTPEKQHIFLYSLGDQSQKTTKKIQDLRQPIIETSRLLLKELNPEIMQEIFSDFSDEELMQYLGLASPEALEQEKSNFRLGMTTYRISYKAFLLVEKETGKVIGKCGFHNWYAQHSRAELGYAMSDESAKRKGYMSEAVHAIVRHGFENMGLNRIEAFVAPANIPSLKLVRGMGFVEEGTLREHFCKNDILEDSVCFSMLKKEYEALKDTFN